MIKIRNFVDLGMKLDLIVFLHFTCFSTTSRKIKFDVNVWLCISKECDILLQYLLTNDYIWRLFSANQKETIFVGWTLQIVIFYCFIVIKQRIYMCFNVWSHTQYTLQPSHRYQFLHFMLKEILTLLSLQKFAFNIICYVRKINIYLDTFVGIKKI